MFNRLQIGQRLIILIAVQAIIMLFVGTVSVYGLRTNTNYTQELNRSVAVSTELGQAVEPVRIDFVDTINGLRNGSIGWDDSQKMIALTKTEFEQSWSNFYDKLSLEERGFVSKVIEPYVADVMSAFARAESIIAQQDQEQLELFVKNEIKPSLEIFVSSAQASIAEQDLFSKKILFESTRREQSILIITIIAFIAGTFVSSILGLLIYQSIANPINTISETVKVVASGDITARTKMKGTDELSNLGRMLDLLLQDKVSLMDHSEKENVVLNDSIIKLLRAVNLISQRDLTINLPVTEDVTGPLADAINKLTHDTSEVLAKVTDVAERVEKASNQVDTKANLVKKVAMHQQQDLTQTAAELAQASIELGNIVSLAKQCNLIAERADQSTKMASSSVSDTLHGMSSIRETINEAGKRIKRLSERSQEIGSVVDLIKDIAERTHVLALNSSVQAAAAGEAGRGFAVIADEVQRLAENAKRATSDITSLVKNIQIETNDTMTTMEKTIGFVVEGSKLAETAGQQMAEAQHITESLISSVKDIASNTERQAVISNQLKERADTINLSTEATTRELDEQLTQTRSLTDFCKQLMNSVKVFKLPSVLQSV